MKRNVNYTELAKEYGCSKQYVAQLVARGDIPTNDDGTINRVIGLRVLAEKAKGSAENGNGKKNGNGKENGKGKPKKKTGDRTLHQAQARLAGLKADIAQIEFNILDGSVVTIDEVTVVFGRLVVAVRQRFLGLGNRVAPIGANKSAPELCEIIDDAVYGALNEFGSYNAETGKCRVQKSNRRGRKPSRKTKTTSKAHSR